MLTTHEIEQLLALRPTKLDAGRAMFYAQREHAANVHGHQVESTPEMRAFARGLAANVSAAAQTDETYNHPGAAPSPGMRKDKPLSPAELAWLERLPEPAATSHTDAVALAQLSRSVGRASHPADARLVASYWEPVRELHARKAAEVELRNVSRGLPQIPAEVHAAHAQATRRETDELSPSEAAHRADERVRGVLLARADAHAQRTASARSTIERLDNEAAERVAVTRS